MACLIFCVLALAIFAGLFVYPPARKAAQLEAQTQETRNRIETQNKLIPLYARLITATDYQPAEELQCPERETLATDEIAAVPSVFDTAAEQCGLRMISAVPQPGFSEDKGRLLRVDLALQGPFHKFRDFLLTLGAMPKLSHLQSIWIKKDRPHERMEVVLWLAVES
jgi:hypothetical protein